MLSVLLASLALDFVAGVSPTPAELAEARQWTAAKFEGVSETPAPEAWLEVIENHGSVQPNARGGKPLRLGDRESRTGLYCHAPSAIIVRLPSPGARFEALAGVDSNDQTSGGRGAVVLSVEVDGRATWTSPLMHEGDAPQSVNVDLGGATAFTLRVADGGDGISCDQTDWAEAFVTLEDGARLPLGVLPLRDRVRAPLTVEPWFSFRMDGRSSSELLRKWQVSREQHALDAGRAEHVITYTDPASGVQARACCVAYDAFPVVEWTLYLKNTGAAESPVISDVMALDTCFERDAYAEFLLRHWNGTCVNRTDYEPRTTELQPGAQRVFTPAHGRPCAGEFPYYNLQYGAEGVVLAVGWPGKWKASFERDADRQIRIAAGQETTHFKLLPGEEVRAPLIALLFWKGDAVRAQNLWRRWMAAHNVPRRNGELPPPQMPAVSGNQFPGLLCNEADEFRYIDRFAEERIPITHWWMDAGWYVNKGDWTSTGTWEVDHARFPRGVRAVADHAHARGLKLILWFEPERVTAGSWLAEQHPDWVLGGKDGGLLNLGNPDAWRWAVDRLDGLIASEGVDFYRQDFNMDPLPYWRANDAPDRQGVTEIRHIEGYLALWDELVRRHPHLMIDSCASGGHRNDLETLRRAVPLLRSDYLFDSAGQQCHTYGLASWVPYWGTGIIDFDAYSFRSILGLDTTLSCDARRTDLDWDLLRRLAAEWQRAAPCFWGDYYPLTPYSRDEGVWIGWQFNRPEAGDGLVQAFRRAESPYVQAQFPLFGLEPDARYRVTNLDGGEMESTGAELMQAGLEIRIPTRPGAGLHLYERVRETR
ncbi:MAG: alpha-galactosidase [Candidatus Hydrogenedentes bacterium]|nr:alpha-galactosidase [Candidatus Hydrogenedentota bacterium]